MDGQDEEFDLLMVTHPVGGGHAILLKIVDDGLSTRLPRLVQLSGQLGSRQRGAGLVLLRTSIA